MPQFIFKTRNLKKDLIRFVLIFVLIMGISRLFATEMPLELATKHGINEEVEVYFSPDGHCQEEIIEELEKAKKTIDLTMYTFTSKELAETLIKAKTRGVVVRVYLDDSMKSGKYSQASNLEYAKIPVKFDNHAGLMHNKFAVIDNETVITGSYNWTKRAEEQNDENVLIIHEKEIAKLYSDKFAEYWAK